VLAASIIIALMMEAVSTSETSVNFEQLGKEAKVMQMILNTLFSLLQF
jgi:hypothetical protein